MTDVRCQNDSLHSGNMIAARGLGVAGEFRNSQDSHKSDLGRTGNCSSFAKICKR